MGKLSKVNSAASYVCGEGALWDNVTRKSVAVILAGALGVGGALGALAVLPKTQLAGQDAVAYAAPAKAGWQYSTSAKKWWYQNSDGTYPVSGSKRIGNATYFFDDSGWMRTGWVKSGNYWYYCESSGTMVKGWKKIGGTWYYFSPTYGSMATGWQKIGSTWYYLEKSGAMRTGWLQSGSVWYYLNPSGAMATGWRQVGSKWYYLDPDTGIMATNCYIGDYYLDDSGAWVSTRINAKPLLGLVNKARAEMGRNALVWSDELAKTAVVRASECTLVFDHTRPDGSSCFTAFPAGLRAAGENLAAGPSSVTEVHTGWMNSPGHYKNIMDEDYNVMGAACVQADDAYSYYWVEVFGYDPNL